MSYRCSGCDVLETLWLRCYDILHIYRRIHFYFIHAHKKVSIWPDMLVCGAELVVDFFGCRLHPVHRRPIYIFTHESLC